MGEDIREEIDRSFGTGPRTAPVDDLVARGHRALARRRLLAGAATALVVVTVGGTAVVASGGPGVGTGTPPGFAVRPSTAPASPGAPGTPVPKRPTRAQIDHATQLPLADYDGTGHLVVAPRVAVVERIDDPFRLTAPGKSVALALDYRGARYWFALYRAPDGSGNGAATWAGGQKESFETWVRDQRGIAGGRQSVGPDVWPGLPDLKLVRFVGGTEQLEPLAGVTLLEQRTHVSVGDSFAGPGDQTAAAEVETSDGSRYYVLARRFDGKGGQYIAVPGADGGPTLAAFLDLARQRYAAGGGLL